MARFLLALFLIYSGCKLIADFSVTAENAYAEVAPDLNESKKEKENSKQVGEDFEAPFFFIAPLHQPCLLTEKRCSHYGESLPGFIDADFTPPEAINV